MITLDPGFANTGSTQSAITFIDGEKGILRYRGYAIEELAEKSSFLEAAFLILNGELPSEDELASFRGKISREAFLHSGLKNHFNAFPPGSPPMAIMSAMLSVLACYHQDLFTTDTDTEEFNNSACRILSKVRKIAAWTYRTSKGMAYVHPNPALSYSGNLLHMLFSQPYNQYDVIPEVEQALDLFFLLHADHEQNCSTSTVRLVGSSHANLFSSVSSGVSALWGPLHGGANVAVIEMLERIHGSGMSMADYVTAAKDKTSDVKLMGFGHRVYKNFDPRAKILKVYVDRVLKKLNVQDPLLDIARELEEVALNDEYFIERKLYPNVDFYSGILLRALGIPENMFTVMFAIGRMPGWISNWREMMQQKQRICRPRQVYVGANLRPYVPVDQR
jgi:citrate synthase